MKEEAFDKIMDCIKESLEAGWTPNWLFMTPRFEVNMREPFEDFWRKPLNYKTEKIHGLNVWLVASLPKNREVMATYLRPLQKAQNTNERLKELAKTALVYDEHNETKLVFRFPNASMRAEFLAELYGPSLHSCKESANGGE